MVADFVKKRIELLPAGWVRGWSSRDCQSGKSSFNALGSMTAPESIWEPSGIVERMTWLGAIYRSYQLRLLSQALLRALPDLSPAPAAST